MAFVRLLLLLQLLISTKNLTSRALKARNSLHFCLTKKFFAFESIACSAGSNLTQEIQFLEVMGAPNSTHAHVICMRINTVSYFTLEIGSLGHFEPNVTTTLSDAFLLSKQEAKQVLMKLSRIAVSCSYHIFNARLRSTWDVNKPVCSLVYFFLSCLIALFLFIRYVRIFCLAQAHHSSVLLACSANGRLA